MSGDSRGPPQLMFDDGSRVMVEDSEQCAAILKQSSMPSQRGSTPLHIYYEIDRMSRDIIELLEQDDDAGHTIWRIALQFPDELLEDSPEVCWLLEDKILEDLNKTIAKISPFCFVLGDTTVNSCCPDEVAAQHLNADVLVHYGHACLSPTGTLPVLYSFGTLALDVEKAVASLEAARIENNNSNNNKFLVLYQVGYHHAMKDLGERWKSADENLQILVGQIPAPSQRKNQRRITYTQSNATTTTSSCCQSDSNATCYNEDTDTNKSDECCASISSATMNPSDAAATASCGNSTSCKVGVASSAAMAEEVAVEPSENPQPRPLVVGGLEVPHESISSWDDLAKYTVIFVMANPEKDADRYSTDDTTTPQQRQYANSLLCLMSLPQGQPNGGYWIYAPPQNQVRLDVRPPPALARMLKRRFFLTQKAKDANVFGILVSNLSQQHLVEVVLSLQKLLQEADRSYYSFAVGKINPAKLANFAEIETFVMVSCREHSLLDQEREYPIPVITPMELEIALGNLQWGMQAYSLDCQDVMLRNREPSSDDGDASGGDDDSDAPYFSMVTGRYESRKTTKTKKELDLAALPGKGQVTEYKSSAADFLRQREYQGLETKLGESEVKTAVMGLRGIASDYTANQQEEEEH